MDTVSLIAKGMARVLSRNPAADPNRGQSEVLCGDGHPFVLIRDGARRLLGAFRYDPDRQELVARKHLPAALFK